MAINPNGGIPAPDAQNQQILQQYATARQNLKYQQNQALDQAQQQVDRNTAITGASGGTALKEQENANRNVNTDYAQQGAALDSSQAGALAGVAATQEAQQFQQGQTQQAQAFTGGQNTQQQQATAALQAQQLGQQAQEFGVTSGQSQEQINNQVNQYAQSLGFNEQQLAQALGISQAQLQQQQGQFTASQAQQLQEFAASQAQQQEQFGTSAGMQQEQIQNQANQFGQNYALASAQFAEAQSEFAQQMGYQWNEFNANQQTNFVNAVTALHSAGINVTNYSDWFNGAQTAFNWGKTNTVSPPDITQPTIQAPVTGTSTGTYTANPIIFNQGPGRQIRG